SDSQNTSSSKPRLPIIYVLDGRINRNALTSGNKTDEWVQNELKKHKVNSIKDVLIAMTDTKGKFIYQLHNDKEDN
ncbi:YetF domain-containing protein, partial [Clostridium tertium]|uniref:YetF domain-containing protein n=2 Tax=Clostridium TaxID=1485 RepID=UPI00325AD5A9